jgi:hypothetical protein
MRKVRHWLVLRLVCGRMWQSAQWLVLALF